MDGLPSEVYRCYAELIPVLLKVYNNAFQLGALPASMNEAIIVLYKINISNTALTQSPKKSSYINMTNIIHENRNEM